MMHIIHFSWSFTTMLDLNIIKEVMDLTSHLQPTSIMNMCDSGRKIVSCVTWFVVMCIIVQKGEKLNGFILAWVNSRGVT